jgi:hypothetical protein
MSIDISFAGPILLGLQDLNHSGGGGIVGSGSFKNGARLGMVFLVSAVVTMVGGLVPWLYWKEVSAAGFQVNLNVSPLHVIVFVPAGALLASKVMIFLSSSVW